MSKNAKSKLKELQKKLQKDCPCNKVQGVHDRLSRKRVITVLDLDECLDECFSEKLITKDDVNKIIEYSQSADGGNFWDMYLVDIEEENGIELENIEGFRKFYEKYKMYEQRRDYFKWITFDCTVYT